MTSSIIQQTFEGHGVRIIADDQNEPWFVVKDVALILGYRDAANMLRNLDTDEKGTQKVSISHDSNDSDGHTEISFTTKVTPKGQEYFINKFLNGAEQ